MILYCICIVVVLITLFVRSRFWSRQPVRHWYNWPSGLVDRKACTKFYDARVRTNMDADDAVAYLLKTSLAYPDDRHVRAYFFNAEVSYLPDTGCIVSRPVTFTENTTKINASMYEFWLASPKWMQSMLCTHEWNRKPSAGLFFTDSRIFGVIPMVRYPIYWIATKMYNKYHSLRIVKMTASNVNLFVNFSKKIKYDVTIVPDLPTLLHYIEAKVMSVYYIYDTDMVAIFIFKNMHCEENNAPILDCIAVMIPTASMAIYHTFSNLMFQTRKTYKIVRLHGLANASAIHRKQAYKSTARYLYAYNYYPQCHAPSTCLII